MHDDITAKMKTKFLEDCSKDCILVKPEQSKTVCMCVCMCVYVCVCVCVCVSLCMYVSAFYVFIYFS